MNALEAINLSKTYSATDGFFLKNKKNIRAVNDISFTLKENQTLGICLLYTSPSPRDQRGSRMPSSA